jgi:uncharacterized OsmC-like protein
MKMTGGSMSRTNKITSGARIPDPAVDRLKSTYRRMVNTVKRSPAKAIGTARTRVRVTDGTTCEVSEGEWKLTLDLPERWGGNDRGANPGVHGRAALGSCIAMAYQRWAAENDLPIDSLEVEIQADYDAHGELGLSDVTPAYTEVRYIVAVESDAPEEEVRRVFELAEKHCPYLVVWSQPMNMRRDLRINPDRT